MVPEIGMLVVEVKPKTYEVASPTLLATPVESFVI